MRNMIFDPKDTKFLFSFPPISVPPVMIACHQASVSSRMWPPSRRRPHVWSGCSACHVLRSCTSSSEHGRMTTRPLLRRRAFRICRSLPCRSSPFHALPPLGRRIEGACSFSVPWGKFGTVYPVWCPLPQTSDSPGLRDSSDDVILSNGRSSRVCLATLSTGLSQTGPALISEVYPAAMLLVLEFEPPPPLCRWEGGVSRTTPSMPNDGARCRSGIRQYGFCRGTEPRGPVTPIYCRCRGSRSFA